MLVLTLHCVQSDSDDGSAVLGDGDVSGAEGPVLSMSGERAEDIARDNAAKIDEIMANLGMSGDEQEEEVN